MSILVGNIRLPLGAADAEALEAAAKKCGLSITGGRDYPDGCHTTFAFH